ncbi:M4 family metallopeptidase [Streptomyces sp. NBC_01340]|uniref:M4 family metallopeptidase n=1 Tax=unclassified Streptomyces TaxID=2593676 RepID=UPI0022526B55|nr:MULTISPECIES: M4 family metallopeptidase [unclassified Streptomyces]MCX4458277.1 M4 family metallopeptidase [Streptomyces sp. NBC_01719]MCX4497634.1 M4 family metallopeptidase [Streptomyces sp. NBC_01728]WSI42459.1 M4 family metallopeptidase [Streptomyces sp. NBC_01340]
MLVVTAVLAVTGAASPAQAAGPPSPDGHTMKPATGTPALVDGLSDAVDASVPAATAARTHLAGHKDRYRIPSPGRDLVMDAVTTDPDGAETVRLDQKYRGVPVLGAQYVVRMTHKNGKRTVTGTSGSYFTGLDVDTGKVTLPAGTAVHDAVQHVRDGLARGGYRPRHAKGGAETLSGVDRGLTVLPTGKGVLARHVTVRGSDPVTGAPVVQEVYVDAATGVALFESGGLPTFTTPRQTAGAHAGGTPSEPGEPGRSGSGSPSGSGSGSGAASVTGSGTLLNGSTVPLYLTKDADTGAYLLRDTAHMADTKQHNGIQTWDASAVWYQNVSGVWPQGVVPFVSPTPKVDPDLTANGAVDAHWAAGKVYEFYRDTFHRNSLDGQGMAINSLVGVTDYGSPFVNAFWDHTKMVYGTGDDEYRSLASDLDVVGHEMTHGMVEHTANLVYSGQSGAMNEALADYFGNAIDVTVNHTPMSDPDAGLIGGDLCRTRTPRQCAFRDLNDGRTTKSFVGMPLGGAYDNGGVHLNSTIFSGALWDIRESLGGKLADQIVYRALTSYITPLDGFDEGRDAVVAAAKSLGVKGGRMTAVKQAFAAHGIVRGWEKSLGLDSDVLLGRLGTLPQYVGTGNAPSVGGGWWAVPKSNPDSTAPYSVWVGRTNGRGKPRQVSPDDGRSHLSPVTDGKRVVWVAVGDISPEDPYSHTYDILSAPIDGGAPKTLYSTSSQMSGLSLDGDTVAWSARDGQTGLQRVSYLKGSRTTPQLVPLGRDYNEALMPAVKDGRIAYVHEGLFDGSYGVVVEVYDIRSGKTTALGVPSEPEWISAPVVTASGVYWLLDTDYADDDFTTLRRADLDGSGLTDLIPEKGPSPVRAYGLAATDTAITLTEYASYSQVFDDYNDYLAKLYQYTPQGAPLGRVSCSVGQQSNAAADTGNRVLWMDTSTTDTDLVIRNRPAGTCD